MASRRKRSNSCEVILFNAWVRAIFNELNLILFLATICIYLLFKKQNVLVNGGGGRSESYFFNKIIISLLLLLLLLYYFLLMLLCSNHIPFYAVSCSPPSLCCVDVNIVRYHRRDRVTNNFSLFSIKHLV